MASLRWVCRYLVPGLTAAILAFLAISAPGQSSLATETQSGAKSSRALLIGCTKYDFNERKSLQGPANDVELMADLLVDRFGFSPENIRRLVEGGTAADRPTRANIVREIEALLEQAGPGQKIVLFFAGHGSQQPDQVPPDPDDPEPDGLDEVLLPCDIGRWNGTLHTIENAIIDDEIRVWMGKLLTRGAELLFIIDSCHSGSAMRGGPSEVARHIDPAELIPVEVLAEISTTTASTQDKGSAKPAAPIDPLSGGKWVALYAALPSELTVELPLPLDSQAPRRQGLFTFSLCQTLRRFKPATYRELLQRIRGAYYAMDRYSPTPLIEGTDMDRPILGGAVAPTSFQIDENEQGQWRVSAGQLHGATRGSIFAVRVPQADGKDELTGYVQVSESSLSESIVRPVAYRDLPANDTLAAGGLCQLVFVNADDQRLKVAIDDQSARGDDTSALRKLLTGLAEEPNSPIVVVDAIEDANWLLINRAPRDQQSDWILTPRSEAIELTTRSVASESPSMQFAIDSNSRSKLTETFQRIARTTGLLGLTSIVGEGGEEKLDLDFQILFQGKNVDEAEPLSIEQTARLRSGGKVQVKLTNRGKNAVDFNLLFVDSQFGIQAIYPQTYATDNRLSGGRTYRTPLMELTASTLGREHILLIAVPAKDVPANFVFLVQPRLELAKRDLMRHGRDGKSQPFDQFLEFIAYRSGTVRGRDVGSDATSPVVQAFAWIVEP